MKVPKYIRDKMRKVVHHSLIADKNMRDVDEWLENNGFDTSENCLRDGSGCSLEELEFGFDIVDELCERIEHMED